jgi:HSP20 family molecular chaperone IbpA
MPVCLLAAGEKVTMSDLHFGTDLFSELDRLQRQMSSLFGGFPSSLRSSQFGTFPHINVGTTDDTIEIVAFAPGVEPGKLDISIDKGLLSIAGERTTCEAQLPEGTRGSTRRSASTARSDGSSNCPSRPTLTRCRRATSTAAC